MIRQYQDPSRQVYAQRKLTVLNSNYLHAWKDFNARICLARASISVAAALRFICRKWLALICKMRLYPKEWKARKN